MTQNDKDHSKLDRRLTVRLGVRETAWLTELCKNEEDVVSMQEMIRRLIARAFDDFVGSGCGGKK